MDGLAALPLSLPHAALENEVYVPISEAVAMSTPLSFAQLLFSATPKANVSTSIFSGDGLPLCWYMLHFTSSHVLKSVNTNPFS